MFNDFAYRPAPAHLFNPMSPVTAPSHGMDWDTPPERAPVYVIRPQKAARIKPGRPLAPSALIAA